MIRMIKEYEMENNIIHEKSKVNKIVILLIFLLFVEFILILIFYWKNNSLKQEVNNSINQKSTLLKTIQEINDSYNKENLLLKTILYADYRMYEISIIDQKADDYYSEAGFSYENFDFKGVESNCRLARGYYSDSSQNYNEIRSEIENSNVEDILIDIYVESLNIISEIRLNLYEACEHFEASARYYDKYYNTGLYSDPINYDLGTSEIEAMNEKITLHDENVRKYNNLLSDFRIELKKRIM